jgi:hypothetical protein
MTEIVPYGQHRDMVSWVLALLKIQDEKFLLALHAQDEKFLLGLNEAEKRNGQRFDAQQIGVVTAMQSAEKAVSAAMVAAEKAVSKAEVAADKRFDGLNELRKMASDWREEFARSDAVSLQFSQLSEKISEIQGHQARIFGAFAFLMFLVPVITGIIIYIIGK